MIEQSHEALLRLQFPSPAYDNRILTNKSFYQEPLAIEPFHPGALTIVTLTGPREKFWGAILDLSTKGLSLRGIDVTFFEDFVSQTKAGDPFTSGVVFFPMHRVERMELDLPDGNIPSLAQRFAQQTGQDAAMVLTGEFLTYRGGEVRK